MIRKTFCSSVLHVHVQVYRNFLQSKLNPIWLDMHNQTYLAESYNLIYLNG
jgi:hypothetical protein